MVLNVSFFIWYPDVREMCDAQQIPFPSPPPLPLSSSLRLSLSLSSHGILSLLLSVQIFKRNIWIFESEGLSLI